MGKQLMAKTKNQHAVKAKTVDPKRGTAVPEKLSPLADPKVKKKKRNKFYADELRSLHIELVKLQEWIKHEGRKVVVIFEGRDAAGKGGVIKRIVEPLNPRTCRVVALGTPTERQKTEWYFQRYCRRCCQQLARLVLFDRSWYNRAGVERVMGFCTDAEYWEFLRSCPEFERMLVRSGITIVKYWFSVSDEEQERRFRSRVEDPTKRWKLSPMDMEARNRWQAYSRAKDDMLVHTDIEQARWYVVNSDNKKRAHLNCISHFLRLLPYKDVTPKKMKLSHAKAGKARRLCPPATGNSELRSRNFLGNG